MCGVYVCLPRQLRYILLPSLGIILRVLIAIHSHVAHIDDITRQIAICNDTYKFAAYPYSILQEFILDNKVMVMSHPEAVSCTLSVQILIRY